MPRSDSSHVVVTSFRIRAASSWRWEHSIILPAISFWILSRISFFVDGCGEKSMATSFSNSRGAASTQCSRSSIFSVSTGKPWAKTCPVAFRTTVCHSLLRSSTCWNSLPLVRSFSGIPGKRGHIRRCAYSANPHHLSAPSIAPSQSVFSFPTAVHNLVRMPRPGGLS